MLIKIALAECFTHGLVAREVHSFSMGYPTTFSWKLCSSKYQISIVAGLFIPTLSGLRTLLHIDPLPPLDTRNDIKIYNQDQDMAMARIMAVSVKKISGADIGIGTTAGVGKGGIAIVYDGGHYITTSDVYADLRSSPTEVIFKRQESGVKKTLSLLEDLLLTNFQ